MSDNERQTLRQMIDLAQQTAQTTGFSFADLMIETMRGLVEKAREAGREEAHQELRICPMCSYEYHVGDDPHKTEQQ